VLPFKRVALALSGGVDSAVLLALLARQDVDVVAYTLATSMLEYSEAEPARSQT